jgi:hypothetical protein
VAASSSSIGYQLPSIRKVVGFCTSNLGWTIEDQGSTTAKHHWIVLRTPAQPLERTFDYFVDF